MTENNTSLLRKHIPQLENEPDSAYLHLLNYANMPPKTTFKEASGELGLSVRTITNYSYNYKWAERLTSYRQAIQEYRSEQQIATLVDYQGTVTTQALEDYTKLRDLWDELVYKASVDPEFDATEFKMLTDA